MCQRWEQKVLVWHEKSWTDEETILTYSTMEILFKI